MMEPTVIAALVAAIVTVVMPYLSSHIKRRENGRIGAAAVEVRRIEAGQQLYDRLTTENEELRERLLLLEVRERALHDALVLVEADLGSLRERLDAIGAADLALRAVQMMDAIRRGRGGVA